MALALETTIKKIFGGNCTIVSTKEGTYRVLTTYLPIKAKWFPYPILTLAYEDKIRVKEEDINGVMEWIPSGFIIETMTVINTGEVNLSNTPEWVRIPDKKGLNAKGVKQVQSWINTVYKETPNFVYALVDGVKDLANRDQTIFQKTPASEILEDTFVANMPDTKIIAEAAYNINEFLTKLKLQPQPGDEDDKEETYQKISKEHWVKAKAKAAGHWVKAKAKAAGKKQWNRIKKTAKEAFGVYQPKTFGGIDISSYEPTISGYKIITDDFQVKTYQLTTPLKYNLIRQVIAKLSDSGNIVWLHCSDSKLYLSTIKGSVEGDIKIPIHSKVRDGLLQFGDVLIDKDLTILDDVSEIEVLDIVDNKIVLDYNATNSRGTEIS